MNNKKHKLYYNTPLNISQTIDLPSNLLRAKQSLKLSRQNAVSREENPDQIPLAYAPIVSPRELIESIQPKKSENVMLIE
jgi:hypothetical protein